MKRALPSVRSPRSMLLALLLIVPALSSQNAFAQNPAPAAEGSEAMIERLVERVSTELDVLYKARRIEDRAALEQLIRTEIVPHIDQQRLTRRVFRQYWQKVVDAGRQEDAQQRVIQSLVRTYAVALSSYSGDTLSVVSVHEEGAKSRARTRIRRPNGQIMEVDFSLGNKSGRWLIDDMAVDGIVVTLTLFNAVRPVLEEQGLDAALNTIQETDTAAAQAQPGDKKQPGSGAKPSQ